MRTTQSKQQQRKHKQLRRDELDVRMKEAITPERRATAEGTGGRRVTKVTNTQRRFDGLLQSAS